MSFVILSYTNFRNIVSGMVNEYFSEYILYPGSNLNVLTMYFWDTVSYNIISRYHEKHKFIKFINGLQNLDVEI